ncbi:hypothetical protein [uncultured Litoreibacter sp.]|uniref:hypothetical protein n=1 Tax=uncultured Litoreibacter sp. TaxID=1392394 RepID=UPI00262E196A|nr:hypothetical protein [uncultured Litoreibacter sp.]
MEKVDYLEAVLSELCVYAEVNKLTKLQERVHDAREALKRDLRERSRSKNDLET